MKADTMAGTRYQQNRDLNGWRRVIPTVVAAGLSMTPAAPALPAFTNAGFEANGPAYNTGYNTFKTPVSGWTLTGSGEAGVMYYADDAFTSGSGYTSQIVGMRFGKGIAQNVSGFTPGQNYVIVWQGNCRQAYGDGWLRITAGGHIIWGETSDMHAGSFVTYTSYVFKAESASVAIQFENPSAADVTTLLDNLQVVSTTNPVIPFVDAFPTATSGSPAYTSIDPGYGVPPYAPYTQLRMQFACSYTMTIRELKNRWKYDVSFYARNRGGALNDFRVIVDGRALLGGTNYTVGYSWVNRTCQFLSTGTTARLKFETFCTGGGDRTVFFDAFRAFTVGPGNVGAVFTFR